MLSRLDTFTGLKVTHVNPTYHSKMEGHVIFTFTLFQIYELGGVGWRSPGGIRWSDTPLYSLYFRYISLEEREGGVQWNQVVRYSSIFTLFQIY